MERTSRYSSLTLLLIGTVFSIQQCYMGYIEIESPDSLYVLWMFVFAVLVAMWCEQDKTRKGWPYEFGFFVFLFWPLVLPYYLIKTRGIDGFIMYLGFGALYMLPGLAWSFGYYGS